ncbi:UPAR/Ly6 domain-containing protein crok-like [Euwallacea similis]|uniref:UPAR/Ly6 domain-containing protein crok-like n=1 Tax=Euwallacea similis TaxID=1736056 RepID=UPI00344B19AE
MSSTQYFFGILCIAVVCISSSFAIKCYECNSATDKRCLGDATNLLSDDLKKPCPERKDGKPYTLCRKIKQVIDFEVNGLLPDSRVIRTCGWDDSQYKNRCYQRSGFGGRQEVCACEIDGCNASYLTTASASLIVTLLVLLKINLF